MRATSVLRHSPWDGLLVALSLIQAVAVVAVPSVPLIAIGLWWNANTVSHNFIHLPFFRSRRMNGAFSVWLTLLLGFPHHLWRARHLAHHARTDHVRVRWTRRVYVEAALVLALWATIVVVSPRGFVFVYLPGYLTGLGLCQLQGHFEHAGGTTSHYGRVYNLLFFRDGLHVEHHARPSRHWRNLEAAGAHASAFPPVLRWLDRVPACLDLLERLVLKLPILQAVVLRSHHAAMARALRNLPQIKTVVVIGGGLFPRTAIIIRQLLPEAAITIVDRDPRHLRVARQFVGAPIVAEARDCDAACRFDADLVIVPLAFVGNRDAFYAHPPAPVVIVHDWIWRRRGEGGVVSWWLLKRLNRVLAADNATAASPPTPRRPTLRGRAA